MSRAFVLGVVLAAAALPSTAGALVWPDVADRVERDLAAADPATRRAAAHALASLGPSGGTRLALGALTDPDDEVRLAAAGAAIRFRAAAATDVVVPWLNAGDPRLRREACEVARALPNPHAVAPLSRTLGDPDPEVRAAAAAALGSQGSTEGTAPLLGRLDDGTPTVRIEIVEALARLGDPRAVVPLVSKVEDSSPDVRQAVVRALGDLDDPRASSALVLALRDQNLDVRRDALTALGRMRAADAVDAIAPFTRDHTSSIRAAALAALGQIATADSVRFLVDVLGTGDDGAGTLDPAPVRDALVAAGLDRVAAPLRALLTTGSPSPQAATSAAWVLGELRAHGEAASIVTAMRRGALPAAAALRALAGAGSDADLPVILEYVTDTSPGVRAEALRAALGMLDPTRPDGRAVEPLADALRDARLTAPERARLATLLGRTGAPRAAQLLIDLAHTKDPSLEVAALDALGTLGPTSGGAADDALLEAMTARDGPIRLHAAMALAEAGSPRAREILLQKLAGADDLDRASVLTALGGILARVPTDAAVSRLAGALDTTAGAERDALIEAFGPAPSASAVGALATVERSSEAADRRAAAIMCAAHPGDAGALTVARALLQDADATVRAQAAWSLGLVGDATDVARLQPLARAGDFDTATNAAAAMGRLLRRGATAREVDDASRSRAAEALCPLAGDARAYVRANAFAGLALAGVRCGDGAPERRALAGDASDDVRAAAALAVATRATSEDAKVLARCARSDPSGAVATRCRVRPPLPAGAHMVEVYVVPEGSDTPRPGAAYALLLGDGMLRAGTTDRRGAVFDPAAPEGDVSLRSPSALAR